MCKDDSPEVIKNLVHHNDLRKWSPVRVEFVHAFLEPNRLVHAGLVRCKLLAALKHHSPGFVGGGTKTHNDWTYALKKIAVQENLVLTPTPS